MSACTTVRRAITTSTLTGDPSVIFIDHDGRSIFGAGDSAEKITRDLLVASTEIDRCWGRTTTRYAGQSTDGRPWTVLVRRATHEEPVPPPPPRIWLVWYDGPKSADIDGAYATEHEANERANALSDEFTQSGKVVDVWTEDLAVRP